LVYHRRPNWERPSINLGYTLGRQLLYPPFYPPVKFFRSVLDSVRSSVLVNFLTLDEVFIRSAAQ